MTDDIRLRAVRDEDVAVFFEQQLDPEAIYMAAFTSRDPTNREAFRAHWARILRDETVTNRTILRGKRVAGYVVCYEDEDGRPEVAYWIGKEYWGQGIATAALRAFLTEVTVRPMYARAAKDNLASRRVLEKCGFAVIGEDTGFANARGQEIEEVLLRLD